MEEVAGAVAPRLTAEAVQTLGITALAVLLFVQNRVRADVVAAIVMTLLVVTGLLTPGEALSGFSNEATVAIGLLLVLTAALLRTGAIERLAQIIGRLAGDSEFRLLLVLVVTVVPLSAFINNTAAVAVLLPAILGLAREKSFSASRVLMPLSFASQLGGTLTLIGSSTNLVVAGLVLDLGVERIRLFDVTLPALFVATAGIVYLLTVGRWLTPRREPVASLLESYELHDYLASLRVTKDSAWTGKSLGDVRLRQKEGLNVVRIERAAGGLAAPVASTILQPGDVLVVEGNIADLASLRDMPGVEFESVEEASALALGVGEDEGRDGNAEDPLRTAEVMVPPRSPAVGRTLRQIGFRARYHVGAIGLRRHGHALHEPIAEVRLRAGDLLLVQGSDSALRNLHEEGELALVGAVRLPTRRRAKMKLAIAIMAGVVAAPALDLAPIVVSAMVGAVLVFLTGCLTPDEAYEDVDWAVIVLIGGLLPLSIAMERSGAAGFIGHHTLELARPLGPYGLLAAVYILTSTLTEVISNAAAAVILTPVAVAVAVGAGLSPLPFVIAVMFAASNAFLSPVGYQTNTFIYGPGGYRFVDYVRVGAPLFLITLVVGVLAIPMFFPFRP